MATLKEYLKTVQELEVNIHIGKLILGYWGMKFTDLVNKQRERIDTIRDKLAEAEDQVRAYQKKIDKLKEKQKNAKEVAENKYPDKPYSDIVRKPVKIKNVFYITFYITLFVSTLVSLICVYFIDNALPGLYAGIATTVLIPALIVIIDNSKNKKAQLDMIKQTDAHNRALVAMRQKYYEDLQKEIPREISKANWILEEAKTECDTLTKQFIELQQRPADSILPLDFPYTPEIEATYRAITACHEQLKQMEITLRFLYDKNIIHEKYRGLIPVSSFCDYFDTGRCDTLTGHEGAYNLYEAELRQDRIIDKLESIEGKLDEIKKNQYYLATSLERGFARLRESQAASTSQLGGLLSAQTSQYASLNQAATKLLKEGVTVKFE